MLENIIISKKAAWYQTDEKWLAFESVMCVRANASKQASEQANE